MTASGARPVGSVRRAFARVLSTRLSLVCSALLAALVVVALVGEVLAADFPIIGRIHGNVRWLPCVTTPADLAPLSRDERMGRAQGDWALGPLVGFGPDTIDASVVSPAPPSVASGHPLGTDAHGRDVFARLVHGTRTVLGVALFAVLAYVALGSVLGALAGFFGGAIDFVVGRATEALGAFPVLVLALVVQALVARPSVTTLLVAIAALRWTEVARLVRADVLVASSQDFAMAARALGASPLRVLRKHVLPHAVAPVIVAATLGVGQMILVESSLDFLRAGLPESTPSWGETLSESRAHPGAYWLLACPALLVLVTVVSLNVVGEALRDALDPRFALPLGGALAEPTPSNAEREVERLSIG